MTLILIISLLVLAAAALAAFRLQTGPPVESADRILGSRAAVGLFDPQPHDRAPLAGGQSDLAGAREVLVERAMGGDVTALSDAYDRRDASLYSEVLDALLARAEGRQEEFRALVSHISKRDALRANVRLAERVIEEWKRAPARRETVEMLHVAALSDDAATYQKAVDAALECWRGGRLPSLTADEVCDLVESQYWVLAGEARSTGAGFALKERLTGIRRALAAARPAS